MFAGRRKEDKGSPTGPTRLKIQQKASDRGGRYIWGFTMCFTALVMQNGVGWLDVMLAMLFLFIFFLSFISKCQH